MNHYDDESNIITLLQSIPRRDIHLVNPTKDMIKFFLSLHNERKYEKWINNSGKDVPPPDFYSEKYEYMLEVMRVDDYIVGNNSPNALESKYVKKVDNLRRENGLPPTKEANIHMLIVPDMSKASENGYSIYVENFNRIVHKHVEKISNYRKNHCGYKLGFLILDESPGYLRVIDNSIKRKAGDRIEGFAHFHFKDRNLVKSFCEADLDFVIWMTPYKNLPWNLQVYPRVCVFDMKNKDKWKMRLIEYNASEMQCLEVE